MRRQKISVFAAFLLPLTLLCSCGADAKEAADVMNAAPKDASYSAEGSASEDAALKGEEIAMDAADHEPDAADDAAEYAEGKYCTYTPSADCKLYFATLREKMMWGVDTR